MNTKLFYITYEEMVKISPFTHRNQCLMNHTIHYIVFLHSLHILFRLNKMSCAEKYDVWEKLLDSTVRFMEIEYFLYAARYSFIIHNMCNQEPTKILFIS